MHPYATDSGERRLLSFLLVGLSKLLAFVSHRAMGAVGVKLPWWIDAPSVAGFYGLVYTVFDKRLWRLSAAHRLGLVKVPDLNGTWTGTVHPFGREHAYEHSATMEITQTWQSLCVRLRTENSRSSSVIGAIIVEEAGDAVLNYEYANEPRAHAIDGMHAHRGTARLMLNCESQVLEGE